jgi:putative ABC transport system ATP-binding protein
MRVNQGEMFAVVGQSGSGKSTLLNLAGALDRPTSGTVLLDGHDISQLGDAALSALRGHRIGFVFQQSVLIEGLDALGNVVATLIYRGLPAGTRRASGMAALDRVGLGHRWHHRPGELSGGEQQRVAIARALVGKPSIVLADEPTGSVDSATAQQLIELLRELNGDGVTIGIVTHDQVLASRLGRVLAIRDGRIESDRRQR